MNAQLKPIAGTIKKPSYGRWDLVQQNREAEWIAANLPAIREWWRMTGGGTTEPEIEFQSFCGVQWDLQRIHYEELKSDGFDDPYERRVDE